MSDPILKSIVDTDLYKLTMQMAVAQKYPDAQVEYELFNRGKTSFPAGFADLLREQINHMSNLSLYPAEKQFLSEKCPFLSPVYLDLLEGYRFDPSEVSVYQKDDKLSVKIKGYWYRTILWEVPIMALISELYFKNANNPEQLSEHIDSTWQSREKARNKAIRLSDAGLYVSDFGSRRRVSLRNHIEVATEMSNYTSLVGTSNVHIAMIIGLPPQGTQAHEWHMWHAAKFGFKLATSTALGKWVDVYKGDLGIALTDTFTTKDFFKNFDMFYAKLYDGVRHDSGDPITFGDAVIEHYKSLNIDPKTKTIIFSDGLDTSEVLRIGEYFQGRIKIAFGVGTHLTNDVGYKPLNIVIKMTQALIKDNWVPTIKLSDDKGKNTGDPATIELSKQILRIS